MITLTVGDNLHTKTVIVEPTETMKNILEENEINYMAGIPMFNGSPVTEEELTQSISEFNPIDSTNYLIVSIKAVGA